MNLTEKTNYSVKILEQNKENIESILKIDNNVFKQDSFNIWASSPYLRFGKSFGGFYNNSLKGFALFMKTWDDVQLAYLVEIAIEKDYQRKGLGFFLLSESIHKLKTYGITSIGLHVDPKNFPALNFYYNKFGFTFEDFRKDEFGAGRDRLYLTLDL